LPNFLREPLIFDEFHQNINAIMEEQKPKSIKTSGLLVAIFSGFVIFSNGMGALSFSAMGMGEELDTQPAENPHLLSFLFSHYIEMCLIMVMVGITSLIGGIFIRKYKMWANQMVSVISVILILVIWSLMTSFFLIARQQGGMEFISFGALFGGLFWSVPIGILIWFLNKKKIKNHFD
jgi:hypothetical protein